MKNLTLMIVVAGVLVVSLGGGAYVITHWFYAPPDVNVCFDGEVGYVYRHGDIPSAQYWKCVQAQAKLFLEKDYAESKDLAKTFLTLLSGVLVASITFSEKIVDLQKASTVSKCMMVSCWILLLIAIVCCGTGLAYMTTAAGIAAYAPTLEYHDVEYRGITLFLASGVSFVFALVALIAAGIISLLHRHSQETAATEGSADAQSTYFG